MLLLEVLFSDSKTYSKTEMIAMGATGSLTKAKLAYIPLHLIDGRDPEPSDWYDDSTDEVKPFTKGSTLSKIPIEVTYEPFMDCFILANGNHRIKQAELNGDSNILAFVEPGEGKYGFKHFKLTTK